MAIALNSPFSLLIIQTLACIYVVKNVCIKTISKDNLKDKYPYFKLYWRSLISIPKWKYMHNVLQPGIYQSENIIIFWKEMGFIYMVHVHEITYM